ncbi:MAG: hypothetical protein DMG59_18175 [Acidobacteria bacterium]|jgi:gas vesicle protein|nr:MAG: hypothetical protein DMG59_18175 [Acidobacteriota bacterium]
MDNNRYLWFAYGIGFGAVAGLLFAPKSGARTRAMIAAKAREGQHFVKDQSAEIREKMAGAIDRSKDMMRRSTEGVSAAVEAGKKVFTT